MQRFQQQHARPPGMPFGVPVSMPGSMGSMPVGINSTMALMAPMRPTMALHHGLIHPGGNLMRPPPMGLPPG